MILYTLGFQVQTTVAFLRDIDPYALPVRGLTATFGLSRMRENGIASVGWSHTTMADEDVKPTSAELQDVLMDGVNENGVAPDNTTPAIPEPQSKRPNFKTRFILSGHTRSISAVKFSPDGSMLASSGVFSGVVSK